jgi:hypothetical protein
MTYDRKGSCMGSRVSGHLKFCVDPPTWISSSSSESFSSEYEITVSMANIKLLVGKKKRRENLVEDKSRAGEWPRFHDVLPVAQDMSTSFWNETGKKKQLGVEN